jgi:hypothetical protein
MSAYLQPQLKNSQEIKKILKDVRVTHVLHDGREVKTLLVYLPIKHGVSCHDEFFEKIKNGILYNFVFSCREIEKKLGVDDTKSAQRLFDRAIRKISQQTAKGELGELILFTLLDVYFEAPKILSKISLKTNPNMPVFGADAVHGKYINGEFRLYLGESKLYKSFKSAASEAAKSIKTAKDKYSDEFDLLESHMDFPNIDDELEEKLLSLLDPFSDNDVSDLIHSPCFIGFAEPEIIGQADTEDDFVRMYSELALAYIADFYQKVEHHGTRIEEVALIMLPYSCVDALVNDFKAYLGIKK